MSWFRRAHVYVMLGAALALSGCPEEDEPKERPGCADDDGDGVCNNADVCADADDAEDGDEDGVPDGCDLCWGDDASRDGDDDGSCNDVDIDDDGDGCQDIDDSAPVLWSDDSDGDGTADDCDMCRGDDGTGDSDGDGTCNDTDDDDDGDGCPDDEDLNPEQSSADIDGDGQPEDCDLCLGDDSTGDHDGDLTCNDLDADDDGDGCSDLVDRAPGLWSDDTDVDGVADDCDLCLGDDTSGDLDGDGLCASNDYCLGNNAAGDVDADGICDDEEPPLPVSELTAVADDTEVDLTWAIPGSRFLEEIVVARGVGTTVELFPEDGERYDVGDLIGVATEVIYVGTEEQLIDTLPGPGAAYYAVWTRDLGGNFSRAARADVLVAHGPQNGSLEVDLSTGTVTVTSSPDHFEVAGEGSYDEPSDQLTIDLDLTSLVGRYLFNAKLVASSIIGAEPRNSGGAWNQMPYWYYGPAAMTPGVPVTHTLVLDADGLVDPVVIDFDIVDHPMAFTPRDRIAGVSGADSGGTDERVDIGCNDVSFRPGAGQCQFTRGVASHDGRWAYFGNRNVPTINAVDLSTLAVTASATFAETVGEDGPIGSILDVQMSSDGETLYAVLNDGQHGNANEAMGGVLETAEIPTIYLLRVHRATLTEIGRVTLMVGNVREARGKSLAISADERTATIAVMNEGRVVFVDLETMEVIDADLSVAGYQALDVTDINAWPHSVAITNTGGTVYVAHRGDTGALGVVDTTSFLRDTLLPTTLSDGDGARPGALRIGPDERLYYARKDGDGLAVFDPAHSTQVDLMPLISVPSFGFRHFGDVLYAVDGDNAELYAFDIATDTQLDLDGDTTDGVVGAAPISRWFTGHQFAITPF